MKQATLSFYEDKTRLVLAHIVQHLDEPLDLGALAKLACLSPFHFHRVFRALVGETPVALARRLRLERAAHRLLADRADPPPITTLAFEAGFETHEAFSRAFRAAFATSPSAFRQEALTPPDGCARPLSGRLAAPSGVHFEPPAPDFVNPVSFVLSFPTTTRGAHPMDVSIRTQPALRAFAVRHTGPYNQIGAAFGRLGGLIQSSNLFKDALVQGPGGMIAVYYDDPEGVPPAELLADAALLMRPEATLPAGETGLTELTLPAGRYATTIHRGPYERLGDVWARFYGQWLPQSGERLAESPSYELYRNTPMEVAPQDLETELYIPLA
jgi:AraC family transcriptional regulator